MKISVAQLNPTIGDFIGNTRKIIQALETARNQGAQLVLFSECAITGYPAEDFLLLPGFVEAAERALESIVPHTKRIAAVIGLPTRSHHHKSEKPFHNSAAVVVEGKVLGFQHKLLLPTYDVFDEKRYFEPGRELKVWEIFGEKVAITICEDIWEGCSFLTESKYHFRVLETLKKQNPTLYLNLSASPYHRKKVHTRLELCKKTARTLQCPVILCNQVGGNDSLIFDGHSIAMNSDATLQMMGKGFEEDQFLYDTTSPSSAFSYHYQGAEELYKALVLGLRDYFHKSGLKKAILGLSGGIDSALVACIAAEALGKDNLLVLLLPSRYSSKESFTDAYSLIERLGIKGEQLSIEGPFKTYLELLTPHFEGKASDVTEENLQARVRGMILMAFSNKFGYTLLATGNKSELAMGYCTLYGDMCGGLAVIGDLTKTEVYELANWINRDKEIIPQNIIEKAPSAELKPNQKDSDTLPDYEVLDQVLQAHVEHYMTPEAIAEKFGYPLPLVQSILMKIYQNEYKRRQAPLALRISQKSFCNGRRFPMVQRGEWILENEEI